MKKQKKQTKDENRQHGIKKEEKGVRENPRPRIKEEKIIIA